MPRNVELERVLQAWYDLEGCAASEKLKRRAALHRLLDEARAGSNISRHEMIIALASRYRDFRAAKEKAIKEKLSRLR